MRRIGMSNSRYLIETEWDDHDVHGVGTIMIADWEYQARAAMLSAEYPDSVIYDRLAKCGCYKLSDSCCKLSDLYCYKVTCDALDDVKISY